MFDFRRDNVGKSVQSGLDRKAVPAGVLMYQIHLYLIRGDKNYVASNIFADCI